MDAELKRELERKVSAGERLDRPDGEALLACEDLAWLGGLAHGVRTTRHGDAGTFAQGSPATEAGTLTYGDGTPSDDLSADLLTRLLDLRQLQDQDGPFPAVTPQPHPEQEVTGARTLRVFAVARLLLDTTPHLRADVAALGTSTAQLALNHGADDLLAAADDTRTPEELAELIRDAGFRPVQRDAGFGVLREFEAPNPARRDAPQPMEF